MKRVMVRSSLMLLMALGLGQLAFAGGGHTVHLDDIDPDLSDKASLQRGAKLFSNFCMGCHQAGYMRYERAADDLGVPHDVYRENIIFSGAKIGSLMTTAMTTNDAKTWFGAVPPDLTLIGRSKPNAADWLYTFLRTFYVDESRPLGANNLVYPNIGMPNVLMELQGVQRKVCAQVPTLAENGGIKRDLVSGEDITQESCDVLEVSETEAGKLSAEEFDQAAYDIANFLYYVGEPTRDVRKRIGVYVLLFLAFLFVWTYLLNREYWKDIH